MTVPVKIGQVAKLAGMSIDAIRFYQRKGLLKQLPRTEGGFRLFDSEHLDRLRFIRQAQDLGFSLTEIRELLFLEGRQTGACRHVQELLERKILAVRAKLGDLRKLEANLNKSLRKCRKELRNTAVAHGDRCPVLAEISGNLRNRIKR